MKKYALKHLKGKDAKRLLEALESSKIRKDAVEKAKESIKQSYVNKKLDK